MDIFSAPERDEFMLARIFPSSIEPVTVIWYLAHGVLFMWFSFFIAPIRHSDRANVTYFWTVSFSTLLLLLASICHAPRLFHSHSTTLVDIIAFAWTVSPFTAVWLEITSKISRRVVGYTITSPLRVWLSNSLLVTIALSIQYMYCLENEVAVHQEALAVSMIDIPYIHCSMMESPVFISIPIVLTAVLLFIISQGVGRLFGSSFKFFQSRHRRHGTGLFDSPNLDQPRPVQTPMVPWFSLSLTTTAIQLLVSLKIFVGRLDIRHILNAVCKEESDIIFDLRSLDGWYDFVSDGGDGFNPSYNIVRLMAQPNLMVHVPRHMKQKASAGGGHLTPIQKPENTTPSLSAVASSVILRRSTNNSAEISPAKSDILILPRAAVAIHGGDLAYPRPNNEVYKTRLVAPIEAAFPPGPGGGAMRPRMFIIPGNHDHYDGLESFVHWIVGRGSLGGWKLPQKSSYFALQLRANWWVLGMDIGLTNDVDLFQYIAFARIIDEKIQESDRVVVLTHRPQWIFDPYNGVVTGDMFHQLLDRVGTDRLAMRLAGDIHHYSRYSGGHSMPQLVTAGGGGAFLHPTHVPENEIVHQYFQDRIASRRRPDWSGERFIESDSEEASSVEDEAVDSIIQDESPISERPSPISRKSSRNNLTVSKSFSHGGGGGPADFYKYKRVATFPSEDTSRKLAWMNIWSFRNKNWGADMIFGTVYICMGLSVMPICAADEVVMSIRSSGFSLVFTIHQIVLRMIFPSLRSVYTDSTFSLVAHLSFFFICWSGAKSRNNHTGKRLAIAAAHFVCHAVASIAIFAMLELAVAFLSQISDGRDSIITEGFRVPGLLKSLDEQVFGHAVTESFLGSFLRFVDFPTSLMSNRQPICQMLSSAAQATMPPREMMFRYVWRVVPFVWVVATPIAASIMGIYLFVNINYLGLHLNEAFSSLRIQDHKHFLRMHVDEDTEDLKVYVIGVDRVPRHWEEDPQWDPLLFKNGKVPLPPSAKWVTPSRWRPTKTYSEPTLVDYFVVPKKPGVSAGGLAVGGLLERTRTI